MRRFALSGALFAAAALAGCSAEGANTSAQELSEADFRAACVKEIGTEIVSPATMEVIDWEFEKLPITEEMMAGVRARNLGEPRTDQLAELYRLQALDRLDAYDRAVAAGVDPITYRASLSFDSLNAAAVPIRADASCLYDYFGPVGDPYVQAEVFPR